MNKLTRYECSELYGDPTMEESNDGEYVRFEDAEHLRIKVEKMWELLGKAEELLNPGREHRMDMDPKCDICVWLGKVGELTVIND